MPHQHELVNPEPYHRESFGWDCADSSLESCSMSRCTIRYVTQRTRDYLPRSRGREAIPPPKSHIGIRESSSALPVLDRALRVGIRQEGARMEAHPVHGRATDFKARDASIQGSARVRGQLSRPTQDWSAHLKTGGSESLPHDR